MAFPGIERIDSPRLVIRPVAEADLADLMSVNGDAQVTEFLPYATWQSPADAAAWLARMQALEAAGGGRQFVIEQRADGRVIGALLRFRHEEASRRLELGYVLGRRHWRQGLMREAVVASCTQAFGAAGIRRIEAEVNPANVASCALLASLGFTLEGTLRQRWVAKGAAYDSRFYGCLADDWQRRHGGGAGA
jgi:RimJ/RimL family protein N-acetyltransferase